MPALHTFKEPPANQEHCKIQAPAYDGEGQSLDCIEDENLNPSLADILKDIVGAGRKQDDVNDLKKAIRSLKQRLQVLKQQQDHQRRPLTQFDDKKGATVLQGTLNSYHKEHKTSNLNTLSRSPRYTSAYCMPLHQVVRHDQIKAWSHETHPLYQQLRFYCPEPCCQAALYYESRPSSFVLAEGARHARECCHFQEGEQS